MHFRNSGVKQLIGKSRSSVRFRGQIKVPTTHSILAVQNFLFSISPSSSSSSSSTFISRVTEYVLKLQRWVQLNEGSRSLRNYSKLSGQLWQFSMAGTEYTQTIPKLIFGTKKMAAYANIQNYQRMKDDLNNVSFVFMWKQENKQLKLLCWICKCAGS